MDIEKENVEMVIRRGLAEFTEAELVIMMAIGAAALLAGYRIKKIAFFIVWFIIGLNLSRFLMPWFGTMFPDFASSNFWQNLIPIAGGLLFAMMGFTIEKICVGGIVFALVVIVAAQYFGDGIEVIATSSVVGVIAAGVAVMMMKPAIILSTSLAGAYVLTVGVIQLSGLNQDTAYFPMLIGITAFGAITQFLTTKHA